MLNEETRADLAQQLAEAHLRIAELEAQKAALSASDQLHRAIIESSPDFILAVDRHYKICYINASQPSLPREQVLGTSVFNFVPPAMTDLVRDNINAVFAGADMARYEVLGPGPEGSLRWFETRIRPRHEDGIVTQVVLTATNIHDRKKAEEERSRLASIFNATSDIVGSADPQGNVIALNPAGRARFGFAPEADISAAKISDFSPAWATEIILTKGIPAAIEHGTWNGETAMLDGNGNEFPISQTIIAHQDNEGNLLYLSTVARDITAQKKAEEALRLSEQRYRSIAANLPNATIALYDRDLRLELIDGGGLKRLGLSRTLMEGQLLKDLVPEETYQEWLPGLQRALAGETGHTENRIGDQLQLSVYAPILDGHGEVVGVVTLNTNITDLRQAQEALRLSEERYRLLAAHLPNSVVTLFDRDMRIILADGPELARLGMDKALFEGQYMQDVTPSDMQEATAGFLRRAFTGETVRVETRLLDNIYLSVYVPATDEEGRVTNVVALSTNITAQKKAEEEKVLSEERYRTLAANLPGMGVFLVDESRRVILADGPVLNELQGSKEELEGQIAFDVVPPPLRETYADLYNRVFAGENTESEFRAPFSDQIYQSTLLPIRDGAGKVVYALEMMQNITAQKKAEEALRFSEERYRILAANLPGMAVTLFDEERRVALADGPAVSEVGLPKEKLEGMRIIDTIPAEYAAAYMQFFDAAFAGQEISIEMPSPTSDQIFNSIYLPIRDAQGNITHVLDVVQNITARKKAEEALRFSEERFRQMAETIEDVVWMSDAKRRHLLYISPSAVKIWGHAADEILADPTLLVESIYPEDVMPVAEALHRVHEGGYDVIYRVRRAGDIIHWVHDTAYPVRDEKGNVYRLVGIARDITALKEAEQRIRDSEERLRAIFENAPVMINSFDATGKAVIWNRACELLLGYRMADINAMPNPLETFYPDESLRHEIFSNLQHADGKAREYPVRVRDGSTRYQIWQDVRLPNGTVFSMGSDITERKRAENERQRLFTRTETLYQLGRALTAATNGEALVEALVENLWHETAVRPAVLTLFDIETDDKETPQEIVVRSSHRPGVTKIGEFPPGSRIMLHDFPFSQLWVNDKYNALLIDSLEDKRLTAAELQFMQALQIAGTAIVPLQQGGHWTGLLVFSWEAAHPFDEDERALFRALPALVSPVVENLRLVQNLEKTVSDLQIASALAQESSRLKSEFLATMSHELRTPLNAMQGFTGIILAKMAGVDYNEKVRQFLVKIDANNRRLLQLVNDFLDLSRIESGRMELAQMRYSPHDMIDKWQAAVSVMAERKGLHFEIEVDPSLPDMLVGDEETISKVVLNLLSNAVKFTEQGGVRLTVRRMGNTWSFSVTDTGIGIPPHAREFIFEEFRQVDQTSRRKFGGTGLGLSIVQKLTRLMGGTVGVQSEVGRGSVFTVTLPMNES